MYMPFVPLWIVKKLVGRYSETACLKIFVSGSENHRGPGFVSAGANESDLSAGSHFSSQFLFKSTP